MWQNGFKIYDKNFIKSIGIISFQNTFAPIGRYNYILG